MALTLRHELGEATARLMISGGHDNEIVLLTAQETIRPSEIVDVINKTTGRQVQFELVSGDEYVRKNGANDLGSKPKTFFEMTRSWWESIEEGDLKTTHPLMSEVLGREPVGASQAIRDLLTKNRDFTWHQNYI